MLSRIGEEFDGECHLSEAEARQIADTITRLQAALEPLALLAGDVNMHDPLSKWFTVSQLVEAAEVLRSSVGGE